ncbi:MAG TPA: IS1595 family transposase [Terriglobales bacterium]|nr:IS1595 family transposase [Terriglobales bacterium]
MPTGKNKYYIRSHISEKRFRRLMPSFALDLTASETAAMTGVSVRSVNNIYLKLRRQIAAWCEAQSPFAGEVEVDESYFGPRRVRGKRGRGASGKTIVFGIFQRNGCVYTQIVPNCRRKTLRQAISGRISLESIIHSDGWSGYDGLVDMGYQKHLRVNHEAHPFAVRKNHVNGIESFWSFAKRRLAKFNGIPAHTFFLHLKETEFRFNHRRANLYRVLLDQLRKEPLNRPLTS